MADSPCAFGDIGNHMCVLQFVLQFVLQCVLHCVFATCVEECVASVLHCGIAMGWLRLVGSLKMWVSFAEHSFFIGLF